MLRPEDLANMRSEWERVAFGSTAHILSTTEERSRTGGYTDAYAETWTGPGEYHTMTASEMEMAQRIEAVGDWGVTLPWDAPVQVSDRIAFDGRTFEVTAILEGGTYLTAKRLTAVERG